jgi:hypothetical protein
MATHGHPPHPFETSEAPPMMMAQSDLEAALAALVKSAAACAETLCAACQRDRPVTPAEIVGIENLIMLTLVDDARRQLLASGTSETAVRLVMPGLEREFRGAFSTRFRQLAPLMATGSPQ